MRMGRLLRSLHALARRPRQQGMRMVVTARLGFITMPDGRRLVEAVLVCIEIGDGPLRRAGVHRRLGHGRRDPEDQALVERVGNRWSRPKSMHRSEWLRDRLMRQLAMAWAAAAFISC